MSRPHVVILGAGFAGMYTAKHLKRLVKKRRIDLTIVNRTNYFLFTPLLHEVATGSLNPRSVAEPIREVFRNTHAHVVQGDILEVDTVARTVAVEYETRKIVLNYDYLIVATGAESNYYGIPGAKEFSLPLKNLSDAVQIRSRIIDAFEEAVIVSDEAERRKILSFAVVGGGATGVEMAAELSDFIRGMTRRYFRRALCDREKEKTGHCSEEDASLTLIHTGKELLEMFSPRLRKAAEQRLSKSGVILKLGSMVNAVDVNGLKLSDGSTTSSHTTIWAAGVKAIIPKFAGLEPALSGGRLIVDQYFHVQGQTNIFALGDVAAYVDVHEFQKDSKNTKAVPMLAQSAVSEAKIVSQNIYRTLAAKPLLNFHYHSMGSMVSVGQWFAIGEIFSMHIAGYFTWWLWRTVYLFKFASWQKRLRIALDWTLDIFFPRDITKLT